MSGRLVGIARTHELRAPLEELEEASISVTDGITGDARGRKIGRQVTVLFREGWEAACREIGVDLPWVARRANLYVEGLVFPRDVNWRVAIGEALLEVSQETQPCHLMEGVHAGLRKAMTPGWRGGVCCRVIGGGTIAVGDCVRIIEY